MEHQTVLIIFFSVERYPHSVAVFVGIKCNDLELVTIVLHIVIVFQVVFGQVASNDIDLYRFPCCFVRVARHSCWGSGVICQNYQTFYGDSSAVLIAPPAVFLHSAQFAWREVMLERYRPAENIRLVAERYSLQFDDFRTRRVILLYQNTTILNLTL